MPDQVSTPPVLAFTVHGEFPPKKDGADSMWGKPGEASKLLALRRSARAAYTDAEPLVGDLKLELLIHLAPDEFYTAGDLDNFVTGVCDGLMRADARASLAELWQRPENASVDPRSFAVILDDSRIVQIQATKHRLASGDRYYEVRLERVER